MTRRTLPPLAAYLRRLAGDRTPHAVAVACQPHGVSRSTVYSLFDGDTADPACSVLRRVLVHGLGQPDPLPDAGPLA